MNIYEKELHGTDEIFNEIKGIVEDDNLGNRVNHRKFKKSIVILLDIHRKSNKNAI